MFFGANCDETSGAFADEWKRPRSPGHHLFLLTKKQGAFFWVPEVCLGVSMALGKN